MRMVACASIQGIWISLHGDAEEVADAKAVLSELGVSEFADMDEIRTALIEAAHEAELTEREMRKLLQFLGAPKLESSS
jgi:hypothetical protein